jgi:hypothetical protein
MKRKQMQTRSAMEKAINEMRDKKSTRDDDDVPADVLELLGEDGLRIVTQLISHLHETGQWHEDFTEVMLLGLNNKKEATNCSNHCKLKFRNILGEYNFDQEKGARDEIGILRIIYIKNQRDATWQYVY